MKKNAFFALTLTAALLLMLGGCGKMPEDDMKWYPADYADSVIRSLDISRTPGKCLEGGVTMYTPQGEWYQSRWKSGEDAPTVQAHEPAQGGPPPADGLTVTALRKLVEQADRWVWEEKGHDTEYHLSGLLYSAESLSIPGAPADFSVRRDHTGTYSVSTGELTELDQNAPEPKGSIGFVEIQNPKSEYYYGNGDMLTYYLIYVIP